MTTATAWVNEVKAQSKGGYFAVHIELMASPEEMENLKRLLFGSHERTQHPIWLSDNNPASAPLVAVGTTPEPEPESGSIVLPALSGTW